MLDYDGDGDLDLFFAQGVPLGKAAATVPAGSDVLLRNEGGGRFADVTREAGLVPKGYGQGAISADYDGDGDPDVLVTRYGRNTLWRNDNGKFVDVSESAGLTATGWSLGAAFADYDRDGDLDLFVADYFGFDPAQAPFDRDPKTGAPDYGMPARFDGLPDRLYRNNGDGTFADVTKAAGIAGKGRGMGVLASDLDGDGLIDFFVANDVQPNACWRNNGDGTFEDRAEAMGLAVNAQGQVEANMGIAQGDADGDGLPEVVVSHFFNEHDTLWRGRKGNDGRILYQDLTMEAGLGVDGRPLTGWGIALADFDLDGNLDLVVACGHVRREPEQVHAYENPPILWRNVGAGKFRNVTATAGDYFQTKHQARGLAAGDLDGDGDLDLVVVHHHARSVVLWNETPNPGRRLTLELRGAGSNRDAIGAIVAAKVGGRTLVRTIDGGGSYLSSGDRKVVFGLGRTGEVAEVEVRWPDGRVETRRNPLTDRVVRWTEGESER